MRMGSCYATKLLEMEDKCQKESNIIEAQGKGDWSERQEVNMPD